jgi:ribonuclease R
VSDEPRPAEFQAIADATKERPDSTQIHTMLLRSMQQAIYSPINSGHFGLAYPAYTHFTSPIRRYPDLLVHRVIKALLGHRKYHLEVTELANSAVHTRKPRPSSAAKAAAQAQARSPAKALPAEAAAWEAAGAHCSANERRADEASRDVEAWLKCRFMREHLGEEFAGTVTAVTGFGLFVTLDELYVEGLVHITELGGEYFRFDEARQELRGERTGVRYAVGTRLRVQVSRVDLDGRKIDFRLVREAGAAPTPRARTVSAHEELAAVKDSDREHKRVAKKATGKSVRAARKAKPVEVEAVLAGVPGTAARPARKSKRARR